MRLCMHTGTLFDQPVRIYNTRCKTVYLIVSTPSPMQAIAIWAHCGAYDCQTACTRACSTVCNDSLCASNGQKSKVASSWQQTALHSGCCVMLEASHLVFVCDSHVTYMDFILVSCMYILYTVHLNASYPFQHKAGSCSAACVCTDN